MDNGLNRERLIKLVNDIIEFNGTEEDIDNMINILESNIIDPEVTDLIFYSKDNLSVEEIVDKALSYKAIEL
ncbi:hypothetical protein [Clostridium tertium]|uniref:hypothetical protein n=1 Tax=Clostridium tertium TaxID=1559 RepID=UPI0034A11F7D